MMVVQTKIQLSYQVQYIIHSQVPRIRCKVWQKSKSLMGLKFCVGGKMLKYNKYNFPNLAVGGHPGQCCKRTSERYGK